MNQLKLSPEFISVNILGIITDISYIRLALHVHGFHICRFNQLQMENFFKFQKFPKKQYLNLPHTSNYLRSIYIVLGIISNLERFTLYGRMCVYLHTYANAATFSTRDLSIHRFWYLEGSWNSSPVDTEGQLYTYR